MQITPITGTCEWNDCDAPALYMTIQLPNGNRVSLEACGDHVREFMTWDMCTAA